MLKISKKKFKNILKSINIKLDFKSSLDEISVYLNNTSSIKVIFNIEFNANFFKNININ